MKRTLSVLLIAVISLVTISCGDTGSYQESYSDGYNAGYEEGYDTGYSEGCDEYFVEDALIVDSYDYGYAVGNVDGFYLSNYSSNINTNYVFSDSANSYFDDGYFDGYSDGYNEYVSVLRNNKEAYSIKDLPLIEVESEAISKIGYDNEESILVIEYTQGTQYMYSNVDSFEMVKILSSESPGKYVNDNVKGTYKYQKLE